MAVVLNLLSLAISIYTWVIIASAIASWLVAFRVINPNNPTVRTVLRVIERLTEPALRPIRRFLPAPGGLDFSPIVLLLILWAVQGMLIPLLARAAFSAGVY